MTVATEPALAAADPQRDIPDAPIYRLSVAQYHAMAEAGILTAEDRVELLQGWLVAKMSKNPPHVLASTLIRRARLGASPSGGAPGFPHEYRKMEPWKNGERPQGHATGPVAWSASCPPSTASR